MKLKLILAAGGVLVAFLGLGAYLTETDPLRDMTCRELTVEMLKMTGTDPTEPFDVERVRDINAARERRDCSNPFLVELREG